MHALGWVVIGLAIVLGGWLAFDGTRALVIGDYVTPSSGDYQGQLGPWSKLVAAVGIPPRSTAMKWIHIVSGIALLGGAACFALQLPFGWYAALVGALFGLWYLPFGTVLSLIQIALLMLPAVRNMGG